MVITPARRRFLAILGGAALVAVLGSVLASDYPGLLKLSIAVYLATLLVSCARWGMGLSRWERSLLFWRLGAALLVFVVVLLAAILDWR